MCQPLTPVGCSRVWEALTELDTTEVLILLGLALGRVPTEALMYRAFRRSRSVRVLLLAVRIEGWANLERARTMGPWTVRSLKGLWTVHRSTTTGVPERCWSASSWPTVPGSW